MTPDDRTCVGIFDAHDLGPTAVYRLMGRPDLIRLCSGCATEAMKHAALDRRSDPERRDRGSRWSVGPLGRRRTAG